MNSPIDSVLTNVGGPLDCVGLCWYSHLAASLPDGPLTLPSTLSDKLLEDGVGSCSDDLAQLFQHITMESHAGGYAYAYRKLSIGGDDSALGFMQTIYVFFRTNGYYSGDPFYSSDSFLIIDAVVYALTDSNLAECGLLETTVGLWVSPLRATVDASILDTINDKLSAGYSSYPYGELESYLESGDFYSTYASGAEVTRRMPKAFWVESRQCYVAKLKGVPFLCKIEPIAPHYGG